MTLPITREAFNTSHWFPEFYFDKKDKKKNQKNRFRAVVNTGADVSLKYVQKCLCMV
jgi:hypothetical protein